MYNFRLKEDSKLPSVISLDSIKGISEEDGKIKLYRSSRGLKLRTLIKVIIGEEIVYHMRTKLKLGDENVYELSRIVDGFYDYLGSYMHIPDLFEANEESNPLLIEQDDEYMTITYQLEYKAEYKKSCSKFLKHYCNQYNQELLLDYYYGTDEGLLIQFFGNDSTEDLVEKMVNEYKEAKVIVLDNNDAVAHYKYYNYSSDVFDGVTNVERDGEFVRVSIKSTPAELSNLTPNLTAELYENNMGKILILNRNI